MRSFPKTYNNPIFVHSYGFSVTERVGRGVRTTYLVVTVHKSSNLTCWPD